MVITVAAWVGLSLPVSIAIGTFLRNHGWSSHDEIQRQPASPRTYETLYARAFPTAERPLVAVGNDSFGQRVQAYMN